VDYMNVATCKQGNDFMAGGRDRMAERRPWERETNGGVVCGAERKYVKCVECSRKVRGKGEGAIGSRRNTKGV